MIDELTNKYNEMKGIIEVLPQNTKPNRKRKTEYLTDALKEDEKKIVKVKEEIERRLKTFDGLSKNKEIDKLKEKLETCKIVNEWNIYNRSYEKIHLDYYLYELDRYYKDDLDYVNECILKIVESFKKVGISLKKEDFNYNELSSEYMEHILRNDDKESLKEIFERIYWKNSDIVKIIAANFRSIYLRYEREIDKFFLTRHVNYLKEHDDEEMYKLKIKLSKDLDSLIRKDKYLNFEKFKNGELTLGDFKDITKIKEKYFQDSNYNYDNLSEIYHVLKEYKILLDYKYLFNDMRDKLDKKDSLKDVMSKLLKDINNEEKTLLKLNSKKNKRSIFGKIKNDEKWLFDYRNTLNKLFDDYKSLDKAYLDNIVYRVLSKDSTILDVLKLICSNYLYFVNKTKEENEDENIKVIRDKYEELKEYVNNNDFYMINNIALLDERQMKQIISNKYNLQNISLSIDSLTVDNIDNTISDINKLITYEDLISSNISLEDISLYIEYNNMLAKENN
jgi:hypothetical protein